MNTHPKTVTCRDGDHALCQSRVVVRSTSGWAAVPCTCFCHDGTPGVVADDLTSAPKTGLKRMED